MSSHLLECSEHVFMYQCHNMYLSVVLESVFSCSYHLNGYLDSMELRGTVHYKNWCVMLT